MTRETDTKRLVSLIYLYKLIDSIDTVRSKITVVITLTQREPRLSSPPCPFNSNPKTVLTGIKPKDNSQKWTLLKLTVHFSLIVQIIWETEKSHSSTAHH